MQARTSPSNLLQINRHLRDVNFCKSPEDSLQFQRLSATSARIEYFVPRTLKKILLIDHDDARRETRVRMLERAGYEVDLREDHVAAEAKDHELDFDLVILALHRKQLDEAAAYSERLRVDKPNLPVLLLLDTGVFVPHGTLSRSVETGYPLEFMREVAEMLVGTPHIRELTYKVGK